MAEAVARNFVLQGFDRATDELRIELRLKPVPIERLRSLFDVGDDYEMRNAYPVDAVKARALQEFVAEQVRTEEYDYFLQRYA